MAPNPSFSARRVFFTRTGIPLRSKTLSRRHQPACKPGSVGHRPQADDTRRPFLWDDVCTSPRATYPDGGPDIALRRYRFRERTASPSLFGLAPGGVYHAGSVAGAAVRSYRTFSPLLPPEGGSGSFSVALSLGSPPPDVIRHRMSMEPGLSSPAAFRRLLERPSGRLTCYAWALKRVASSRYGGNIRLRINYPEHVVLALPSSTGCRRLRR